MSAAQNVCHPGVVESVGPHLIRVNILSRSACGSCHAKSSCSLGESQDKTIDIYPLEDSASFTIGEQVEVIMQESMGLKALFWGYITPFIFVLLTLILLVSITGNEKLAGLISLATLFPYYVSLYFFRHSLKKTFSFSIRKIENQ
jgi:sigma-E factor negative regulatory protein RseC